MAEGYKTSQIDTRNLGTLLDRLIDDLNRPDLRAQALSYVQDTIRYYQPKRWLFNEQDNTAVALYQHATIYPQGSLIQVQIAGTLYAVCALNTGTSASSGTPVFPTTIVVPPTGGVAPPPPVGTPGTVVDNTITWGTVGLWSQVLWTQLSTVYQVNQYTMPVGYQAPERVEITTANLRLPLEWVSYEELRDYDVVEPAPITAYPRQWAWFQQQLYLWPYPAGFFPITVSFYYGPPMISAVTDSNFWTTRGEAMVRAYTAARMSLQLMHDPDGADHFMTVCKMEERTLKSQAISQRMPANSGIPASGW